MTAASGTNEFDPYEVLGVGPEATADEIRSAYRQLARELHPDVNPDAKAAEQFKKVNNAYHLLSDEGRRAEYDQYRAQSQARARSQMQRVMPPPGDPMAVARKLLEEGDTARTLRRWRGQWMRWRRTHWAEVEETEIRAWVYGHLEHALYLTKERPAPWNPNRHKIANVLDALISIVYLPQETDSPSWIRDQADRPPADRIVACANGLLDVTTRTLHELTPDFFSLVAVPFDYDADTPMPTRWLGFLDTVWPDDGESVKLLQEWYGYVISGRTDLQKILLLIGPTRSGKGTIGRILATLIGRRNTAGPTLASLGTNFGLSPLLDKPLALVSDARLGAGSEKVIVERLLSISGEDLLTVDREFRVAWNGKIPARIMILSNEVPRFGDASGAIAERMVVLAMTESFLGREDVKLGTELLAELPGILNWALDGLDRLAKTDVFTETTSSRDTVDLLRDLVSPMAAFVRDSCTVDRATACEIKTIYGAYTSWCELNGHHPVSAQVFGRDLRAAVPSIKMRKPHGRPRRYTGIKPTDAPDLPDADADADETDGSYARNGANRGSSGSRGSEAPAEPHDGLLSTPPDLPEPHEPRFTSLGPQLGNGHYRGPYWTTDDSGHRHRFDGDCDCCGERSEALYDSDHMCPRCHDKPRHSHRTTKKEKSRS